VRKTSGRFETPTPGRRQPSGESASESITLIEMAT